MIPALALSTLAASGQTEAQVNPKTEQKAQGGHRPSPLPKGTKWWVEIEKPDGPKVFSSIAPKMKLHIAAYR